MEPRARNSARRARKLPLTLTAAIVVVGQTCRPSPPPATAAAQWRLADVPVFELGRDDGVLLHLVRDAVFAPDGSLLVADNSGPRLLRVSSTGEVVDSRGREGNGPGEFDGITRVFSLGDTVLAYDGSLGRVTTWVGDGEPQVVALPKLGEDGEVGTGLAGVVSAKVWVLYTWGSAGASELATELLKRWQDVLVFDANTQEVAKVARYPVNYSYMVVEQYGVTGYRLSFLGEAHVSATSNHWLFVPLDEAVLLRGSLADQAISPVSLPLQLEPYSKEMLRGQREDWLSRATGSYAARVRLVFDNLSGEMPALAPPIRQLVHVGEDVWLQKFGGGQETEATEWVVVDPSGGNIRATASLDAEVELLGGSDSLAVVLVRTELDEEFVQVRRILR